MTEYKQTVCMSHHSSDRPCMRVCTAPAPSYRELMCIKCHRVRHMYRPAYHLAYHPGCRSAGVGSCRAPPRLEICSCWSVHVAPVPDKRCGSAVPLVAQGRAAVACCRAIDAAPAAVTDPVTNIQFTSYKQEYRSYRELMCIQCHRVRHTYRLAYHPGWRSARVGSCTWRRCRRNAAAVRCRWWRRAAPR